jgi:nucleosome-remodeling factor subunit BPTF
LQVQQVQQIFQPAAKQTFQSTVGKQIIIQQNPAVGQQIQHHIQPQQQQQQQQHLIIKQQGGQKIIQQILPQAGQQFTLPGGQRIILSPGQRLVNQTIQVQPQQQQVQQIFQQQPQIQQQIQQHQQQQQQQQQQPQIIQQQQPQIQQQQTTQIVVQNQNLAHQIATGKVQMTTINGQQVFVRHLGNQQAEIVATIKQQQNGPAQVIPTQTMSQEITSTSNNQQSAPNILNGQQQFQHQQQKQIIQRPQQQQIINKVQPQIQQQPQISADTSNQISSTIEQSLLQGQPPGTIIKCVTAQVIQTQNGPRIVLQGLQGSEFTQQQSALVQQQVKQQLLKG